MPRRPLAILLTLTAIACSPSAAPVPPPESAPPHASVAVAGNDPPPAYVAPAGPEQPPVAREEPSPPQPVDTNPLTIVPPIPMGTKRVPSKPITEVPVSPDDPLRGNFSLADATRGLDPGSVLLADIDTSEGMMVCRLLDQLAPRNVANFVGLARGIRPFKDPLNGRWTKRPLYDKTTFHRVVRDFMIQGGDPTGTGRGEAGFVVPDEIWENGSHDRAGLLCTANRGPNTNGMQFFITDAASPRLDGSYTIFGMCAPTEVVSVIASMPVTGERPTDPVQIRRVGIRRVK